MRGAPETDQISFRPISRHAGCGPENVRVVAGARRSPARSHADAHRPGKFSCPQVESLQLIVQPLHCRVVKWCKSVGARYGHRGGEGRRSHQPRSSKAVASDSGECFPVHRFEILSSDDELEVFTTVPASSGAVREVQEARESQAPRGQLIGEAAPTQVVPPGGVRRRDCGRCLGKRHRVLRRAECGPHSGVSRRTLRNPLTMSNFSGVILQGGPELFAMSDHEETPQDVLDAFEQD